MWKNQGQGGASGKVSKWKSKLTSQPEDQMQAQASRKQGGQTGLCVDQILIPLLIHNNDYSEEEVLINQLLTYRLRGTNPIDQSSDIQEVGLKDGDFIEISIHQPTLQNINLSLPNQSISSTQLNQNTGSSNFQSPQIGQSSSSNSQIHNPAILSQLFPNINKQVQSKKIICKVKNETFKINESVKQQKLQLSILKQIAEVHGLKANMLCKIRVLLEPMGNSNQKIDTQQSVPQSEHNSPQKSDNLSGSRAPGGQQSIDEYDGIGYIQPTIEGFIAERVEVSFRDQYVSRRDMWFILKSLENKTIYKGKNMEFGGIRFRIRGIYGKDNQEMLNGLVRNMQTKFSFFTRSCQIYVLIEFSEEMYLFDENGFTGFEKCVQFLKSYFERCQKISATHEITLVIYSRIFYPQVTSKEELKRELQKYYKVTSNLSDEQLDQLGAFHISKHTKIFQDVYIKVGLFELGRNNWDRIINSLKKYFNYFPSMVNWTINCPKYVDDLRLFYPKEKFQSQQFFSSIDDMLNENEKEGLSDHYMLNCKVGNSIKMNILEAINLALFNLNNEEEDQNLKTTGQQMIIISAGSGAYRVNAEIVEPTKSRLILGGIPIQIISLNKRPNFKTPLLINCCNYQNPFKSKSQAVATSYGNIGQISPTNYESPINQMQRDFKE